MKPLIYFICTGNSARSQMAEGYARAALGDRFEILSGGLEPSILNPLAVRAMAEVGIDISHHFSKPIDADRLRSAHIAVTLCGDAEERCPLTPPEVLRLHWGLEDPAKAVGEEEDQLMVFRRVRDLIAAEVADLKEDLRAD
jgi:arsenate reductase